MLARIYGIFQVKSPYFAPLELMVMQNTAHLLNPKHVKYKFDLKGSLVNRRMPCNVSKAIEYEINKMNKKSGDKRYINFNNDQDKYNKKYTLPIYKSVLKDHNFIELNQNLNEIYQRIFHLKTKDQEHLKKILQ